MVAPHRRFRAALSPLRGFRGWCVDELLSVLPTSPSGVAPATSHSLHHVACGNVRCGLDRFLSAGGERPIPTL
jgi:hypothetical protein